MGGGKRYVLHLIRKKMFYELGKNVTINYPVCKIINKKNIAIGENTVIEKFARIEPVLSYATEKFKPLIKIGNNVCINQNFHCTCAQSVIIGNGTSITANCGIFDIIHPYDNIFINPRFEKIKVRPVTIGENCLIGMNSVILPGTTLGNHCIVGANSVVSGHWPDNIVLVGTPAKAIKRYNFSTHRWEKTNPDGSFID